MLTSVQGDTVTPSPREWKILLVREEVWGALQCVDVAGADTEGWEEPCAQPASLEKAGAVLVCRVRK